MMICWQSSPRVEVRCKVLPAQRIILDEVLEGDPGDWTGFGRAAMGQGMSEPSSWRLELVQETTSVG